MTTSDPSLSARLRALRDASEDDGFSMRIHEALRREAAAPPSAKVVSLEVFARRRRAPQVRRGRGRVLALLAVATVFVAGGAAALVGSGWLSTLIAPAVSPTATAPATVQPVVVARPARARPRPSPPLESRAAVVPPAAVAPEGKAPLRVPELTSRPRGSRRSPAAGLLSPAGATPASSPDRRPAMRQGVNPGPRDGGDLERRLELEQSAKKQPAGEARAHTRERLSIPRLGASLRPNKRSSSLEHERGALGSDPRPGPMAREHRRATRTSRGSESGAQAPPPAGAQKAQRSAGEGRRLHRSRTR